MISAEFHKSFKSYPCDLLINGSRPPDQSTHRQQ
jgi:hypothetical protein